MNDENQDIEETENSAQDEAPDDDGSGDSDGSEATIGVQPAEERRAILNDEIEIFPDQHMPQFDNGSSRAYGARAMGSEAKRQVRLFAMVCEKHMIPRARLDNKFSGIINPSLVRLLGSGIVFWPPANEQRYVFIYENSLGNPIMKSLDKEGLGWKQDAVMNAVIKPMVNVFLDLRDASIFHGHICPLNMYDGNAKNIERILLGECLSTPPGATQPIVCEPIERAMTDPLAKGAGAMEDDLYSFGVALTMILRTKDPLKGLSEEEIIKQKIELGSYAALTGKERFTGGILELLRGLLYDDSKQRWTIDEVMVWMEGQRLSPKQSSKKKKASRPVHFNNERYFRTQTLSLDLDKNQSEAVQLIDSGTLEQWITRSLEDKLTHKRFETAVDSAQELGRGPGYWDRLLSRVAIALDPPSPLRYKGLAMQPDGISYALVSTVAQKKDIKPYIDIINQQLVMFWLNAQIDLKVDVGTLASKFENCRAFLKQNTMGYGIERCLYFLSPECPCMSEKLEGYYVLTPEAFMYACENIAQSSKRPDLFLDRHVVAFLSVKDRKVIDGYISELGSEEYHKRIVANIKCLATIQKRSRMEMFPGLSDWAVSVLEPVYERFHDRRFRKNLREKMEKLRSSGNLSKIAGLLDNNRTYEQDMGNFKQAMDEYKALQKEKANLEEKLKRPESFGKEEGREYAAIFSFLLGVIIIVGFTLLFFNTDGDIF